MKLTYKIILFSIIAILFASILFPESTFQANNNATIEEVSVFKTDVVENPQLSQWYPDFIHIINDNWTEGSFPWLIEGDGTVDNPHIIQDVVIDGGGSRDCIIIENCNQHFIIRNSKVYNSGTYKSGIQLIYTNNGKIINNNCSHNGYGIYLKYSSNNNVSNNILENNTYRGITNYAIPEQGRNADNNIISNNNLSNSPSNAYGIYIFRGHNINVTENNIKNNGWGIIVQGIYVDNYINSINLVKNNLDSNYIGISLRMVNNSAITDNLAENNEYNGIQTQYCDNLEFVNNVVRNNGQNGLWFGYCNNINCTLIRSENNTECGIFLTDCNDIKITKSIIEGNELSGLYALRYVDNCEFIENEIINNKEHGIFFKQSSDYNTFLKNNISNNNLNAVNLKNNCHENMISNNTIEWNKKIGIHLVNCDDNKIRKNLINNNIDHGISLSLSHNNTISENKIYYNNEGIILDQSNDNIIPENIIKYNNLNGIHLENSNKTTISENTVKYNNFDGFSLDDSNENIILFNTINYNDDYGIHLNYSDSNIVIENNLIGNLLCIYEEFCQGNVKEENFCDCHPLRNLYIAVSNEYFTDEIFIITIYLYNSNNEGVNSATFQIWWNGSELHSDNITNGGDGYYNVSLISILVSPEETPILLNMSIVTPGYYNLYYDISIKVDPESVNKGREDDSSGTEAPSGEGNKSEDSGSGGISIEAVVIPAVGISVTIGLSAISIIFFLKKKRI